ncbi:hypothetical protein EGJ52_17100 [Pseudomonas luteola]|uniref:hypothetical protein n=1 Tax=Pseudomonas luteola TaxID=47886 RepID=UPI000F76ED0A|nr:hypothetical protein [Pseudomonas luteola]RRW42278.1 hypothetical protein EGJ52_17100 [Pseudomonas luteola]
MTTTVFLQKFSQREEIAIPFEEIMPFLSKYGVIGKVSGGYEVTFPPDEIADVANIVGSEYEGVLCIGIERPFYGDSFRDFAFEAMQQFGLTFFDDALEDIYVVDTNIDDIPRHILEESEKGATVINSKNQIWQVP